ncbi:pirin family protein [Spongiibacter tropicus]|uniref:pirin family protein n=1 Tax=Spongiibacter tropicus TaxID=454602 RepID=UPI0003B42408|nr:pirin family protein [Spongiibacter tropicus]
MSHRNIAQIIPAVATSDGAGVKLKRSLGQSAGVRLDPFLMLDEFYSDQPEDYLAGFPSHPHRGFETVTYMLAGHMLHEDHMGNRGDLGPGDVQWMTAGRGIIHSEMPQQESGLMRGFQLWVNLPAAEKLCAADYHDIPAAQIPSLSPEAGISLRHIAGRCWLPDFGQESIGYVNGLDGRQLRSDPLYLDIGLAAGNTLNIALNPQHNAFVYAYDGEIHIGDRQLTEGQAGILTPGDQLCLSTPSGGGALVLAGQPLREPIVQYGPFVMNSSEEIEQALRDYRDGRLTA